MQTPPRLWHLTWLVIYDIWWLVIVYWPYVKVKKGYIIRCRLMYCTLVSGMLSMSVSVYKTFGLHLWPSVSVKVTFTLIVRCILCCCILVSSIKFVGYIELRYVLLFKKKWCHNGVIINSILWNSNTKLSRAYLSDIKLTLKIGKSSGASRFQSLMWDPIWTPGNPKGKIH